jgi:serpin B
MHDFSTVVRPDAPDDLPAESLAALVTAGNSFAFDLWAQVRTAQGNFAISPASIFLALVMTCAGARGETAAEMAKALRIAGLKGIHPAAAGLLHRWNDPERTAYVLRVVNRLFGEQTYRFEDHYLDLVRKRYGAPLEPVDFCNAPEPSRARINTWIAQQTAGRIQNLLAPGTVSELTSLVLTNAVYFSGKWINPFEEHDTSDARFRAPESEIHVPTMHQTDHFSYGEVRGLQILEMRYVPGEIAMTVLLPNAADGLESLEASLSAIDLNRWLAGLQYPRVQVALPKFTIDPAEPVGLKSTLAELGMVRAFDRDNADFSGIAAFPDPRDRLLIDEVAHKSFVKVNEAGTEAAAASVVVELFGAIRHEAKPKQFTADHPFLFLIRDTNSKMILFIGRLTDPKP